jgi:hypothetical protein
LHIAEIEKNLITRMILYQICFIKRRKMCGSGGMNFAGGSVSIVRYVAAA